MNVTPRRVLITGATGYLGRALVPVLVARGHRVRALVRPGSEGKRGAGVESVAGNPLVADDIAGALSNCDTLVHLVGVPKPSPAKARQFREVDRVSIQAAVAAVERLPPATRPHLVYLSVAQPAPVMRAYVAVRAEGEALVRARGLTATFLRPWYVLGPGHRWPMLLMPIYALLRRLPPTRAAAERLGFVTLAQMTAALVQAVEQPPSGQRVLDVPAIRSAPAI
ncbi:MAG: NAD(P)H-binding protein [Opitutaceae bacterium]|nr:NAD(P)H-binding protein [Opitutaceae bacterium]